MSDELMACPFCGFRPGLDDMDCVYPVNRDKTLWSLNCYETGGGCGAQVLGRSRRECIDRWNTRAEPEARRGERGA